MSWRLEVFWSMNKEGAMSIPVVKGILPLLFLTWLPTGLAHQSPQMINVSLGSDLTLHCLPQMLSSRTDMEPVWCSTPNTKKMGKEDMDTRLHEEIGSFNLTFAEVKEEHAGNYTCKMGVLPYVDGKNKNYPCKSRKSHKATGGKPKPSSITLCRFMLCLENETVHVRSWTCPELSDDTLERCKVHHSDSHGRMDAASAESAVCTVSSRSFKGAEDTTQGMGPSSDPKTSPTREPQTHKDLIAIIYMYAIPGLVVMTLFLLLCILVCLCRRSRRNTKGTPESKHAAEMNQLSTPPPSPQTEDMTYAKLIFESTGTIPAASEVEYMELKPLQKK